MTSRRWSWGRARWVWWCHEVKGQISSTVLTAQWKVIRQTVHERGDCIAFHIIWFTKGKRKEWSLQHMTSSPPVQFKSQKPDRRGSQTQQLFWHLFGEGGSFLIPPRCVLKARGRETFWAFYLCMCVCSCVCVCVQTWHHYSQVGDYCYPQLWLGEGRRTEDDITKLISEQRRSSGAAVPGDAASPSLSSSSWEPSRRT